MQKDLFALTALSPLDGRYSSQLSPVAEYFSEYALIRYRVKVEVEYLLFLADQKLMPPLSGRARQDLKSLAAELRLDQAEEIKTIERETKHDVKAVEYFIRQQLQKTSQSIDQYVHLGLTSEDTNSLALALMLKESRDQVIVPQLHQLLQQLATMAADFKSTVLLARTHGQAAVPTTMGKELVVFAVRLCEELKVLSTLPVAAKLSGAVGTFAAQMAAFPKADWQQLSHQFIVSLGLTPAMVSTQIVAAESYTRIFSSLVRVNGILLDLDQDMWRYISDGYFIQSKSRNQVGSSTMPHKINPIDFENSEGNLGLATSLLTFFIQKLPVSRLQRDLSDSTVKRNFGSALGYAYLGYTSLLKGLGKLTLDENRLQQDVEAHWEVVSEAFQVILRAHGDTKGYEKLKAFSQGKKITTSEVNTFIESLDVSPEVRAQLQAITPVRYIGLAPDLVTTAVTSINTYLKGNV